MHQSKLIVQIIIFISVLCTKPVSGDTIKIGIVGPFSGPYVAAGDQQWQGAIQAVDDINKDGGINGHTLLLVSADDSCDPKKAVDIAKRFVESTEIQAVVGHNCSGSTLAAAKIYAHANMLMITPASTAPEITMHNYNSIFRTCGRDDEQGQIAAIFLDYKLKAKKIAVFYNDSLYSKGVAQSTKVSFEKLGGRVVLYQEITSQQIKNFSLIEKILRVQPDVIYFGGLHIDAGIFLKYLRDHGIKTTFFGSDGIASPDFVQAAGGPNNVKNVYMTFLNDPLYMRQARKVVRELEDKHINPTGYTLNSYAAVQVVAAAIQNAPKNEMSEWLHHNKVDTVIGTLEWDRNGDLKMIPFIVYKWNSDGGYEPYWSP